MFTNLIESQLHVKEFKRRGSFFLVTVAAYSAILFTAGIVSVYAYDAQLEAQTSSLEILEWVKPPTAEPPKPVRENRPATARRSEPSNAPVDRNITVAERRSAQSATNDPRAVPDKVGIVGTDIPTVTGPVRLTGRDVDPLFDTTGNKTGCVTCSGPPNTGRVETEDKPPEPAPVKPPATRNVSTGVLLATAISLPQPAYPPMAKQIKLQGAVSIQILVDEKGKVISAQTVSGHPLLTGVSKEAAMRARFTPATLSGQPVKVQGVITYNFVLQ